MLQLPYVKLPKEFSDLLKRSVSTPQVEREIFDALMAKKGLNRVIETAFKEFDDGKRLNPVMYGLKWPNFRERLASIYVHKNVYGDYPLKTNMELVEGVVNLENKFRQHGIHNESRLFLLGFYMKLSKTDIVIPESLGELLKLSSVRTSRIDWLILVLSYLVGALGEKVLANHIASGKKFQEIYKLLSDDSRFVMIENLLRYGASIQEDDIFLFEKI
jgi:hypothetical protein